jgi:uncharacterized protein
MWRHNYVHRARKSLASSVPCVRPVNEVWLFPSRYNFSVSNSAGAVAIFNARTGALLRLAGESSLCLAKSLENPKQRISSSALPSDLLRSLLAEGFLVNELFDEVAVVRETYWRARGETPMVLTITTTMDCNLGCYYCYETRSHESGQLHNIDEIVDFAKTKLRASNGRSLHVDWYGGEPLLNLNFLEATSYALQNACAELEATYVASVVSNGTEWPDDVGSFVGAHRIRQVQISFDGMQHNHDKRRHYRKPYRTAGASSFATAVQTVDRLKQHVHIDLRFNLDSKNCDDLVPFVQFARDRGWFDEPNAAVLQPARISAYSSRSGFLRASELSLERFDELRAVVRQLLCNPSWVEESEIPDGYPFPKTSVCAALAMHSQVVGADGLAYRCGLQVGEKHRAVGAIFQRPGVASPQTFRDADWWREFDPTRLRTCSKCSFLPICWGGCPKKHLECDEHATQEQGRYWRTNLPRLIATRAGIGLDEQSAYSESDQFRPI